MAGEAEGESRQSQEPSSVEALLLAMRLIELVSRLLVIVKESSYGGSVRMYRSYVEMA